MKRQGRHHDSHTAACLSPKSEREALGSPRRCLGLRPHEGVSVKPGFGGRWGRNKKCGHITRGRLKGWVFDRAHRCVRLIGCHLWYIHCTGSCSRCGAVQFSDLVVTFRGRRKGNLLLWCRFRGRRSTELWAGRALD